MLGWSFLNACSTSFSSTLSPSGPSALPKPESSSRQRSSTVATSQQMTTAPSKTKTYSHVSRRDRRSSQPSG